MVGVGDKAEAILSSHGKMFTNGVFYAESQGQSYKVQDVMNLLSDGV